MYSFVSLFSGILGLDLGLENAGMHCLAVNDTAKNVISSIRDNRPDLRCYGQSVSDIDPHQLLADLDKQSGEIFALVGGPPCQAFSTVGMRRSISDDRGALLMEMHRFASILRPHYVVIENVRGLLSVSDVSGGKRGIVLRNLYHAMIDLGYKVSFNLYDTALFGAPQHRERLIMICTDQSTKVPYLYPTHFGDDQLTFSQATLGIERHDHLNFPEWRLPYFAQLSQGQHWTDLPEETHQAALGNLWNATTGGRTSYYRRLSWNKPTPALTGEPHKMITDMCHPEELRPLSVQEYARLQQIPDDFTLQGSLTARYRLLANAVPVNFGTAIGKHLIEHYEGTLQTRETYKRLTRYSHTSEIDPPWNV